MMDDMEATACSVNPGTAMCFGSGAGTSCPCGNAGGPTVGCANSATNGAGLYGTGVASVIADTLQLHTTNAVSNASGIFFGGTTNVNGGDGTGFGDGLLCAGGAIVRLEVSPTDGAGATSSSVGISTLVGANAGDIRYYQYWYRDPVGVPCGSCFKTSSALQITWTLQATPFQTRRLTNSALCYSSHLESPSEGETSVS